MPIFKVDGKNVLFVHIPKTAGTSVETWIQTFTELQFLTIGLPPAFRCTPQHLTSHDIINLFGEGYFDFSFAIVRNPFDRIISEFRMRQAEGQESFWKKFPTFSLWLEENLETQSRDRWHLDNHLRPQWEFISSETEVFRYEDGLESILRQVANRLNLKAPESVPHKLNSQGINADMFPWDIRDALLIRKHYELDFINFGYPNSPATMK